MPELPEVETVMRGLEPVLLNQRIRSVTMNRADLRIPLPHDLQQTIVGQTVNRLHRRAKYILVNLSNAQILAVHLGMSGKISILPAKTNYIAEPHDHLLIDLESGTRLIYNDPRRFGMIFTLPSEDRYSHKAFAHLGPEPFSNEFDADYLKSKLKNKTTSIKQALLDQRLVVGVGNIYACEALYQAGIDPKIQAGKISKAKLASLIPIIQDVLSRAIKAGGSTLKDYRKADGELGYFQHSFNVYDRKGLSCGNCDCNIDKTGGVQRIVQSGRSTFFCPKKQRTR